MTFAAGPCAHPRGARRTPLRDATAAVGVWADVAGRRAGIEGVLATVDRNNLARNAGLLAPRGVLVSGVRDRDWDGLDDDARVTLRHGGQVVCVQLPVTVRGRWRIFRTPCHLLPRRDMRRLRSAYERLAEHPF